MSDSEVKEAAEKEQQAASAPWSDETVDALAAVVVVSCLTLMVLWFVIS